MIPALPLLRSLSLRKRRLHVMIPGGDSVMLVKHLLPSLPGLLPVLAGVGLGLCAGGVLLIRCSHGTSRAVI